MLNPVVSMFLLALCASPSYSQSLAASVGARFLSAEVTQLQPSSELVRSSAITEYARWLQSEIRAQSIPGVAMAVVTSGSVLDIETWGVREYTKPELVDHQTLFRIASVSKTFAGAAAARLVEDQGSAWDIPLVKILPQYAIGTGQSSREMTLRHVLSHTTGLMPHAFSNMLDAGVEYEAIQEKFDEIPTVCPPGRCYGYQNVVFSLVSDVIQAAAHQSYAQYLQQHIFNPLGMVTASVGLEGYAGSENVSSPHQFGSTSWRVVSTNPAYYSVAPAAGVNASIEDMARWAQANLGGFPEVLSPALLAEQHSPVVETPHGNYFNRWPRLEKAWYGLGWRVFDYAGKRVIHHGGGVRGFRSELVLVPEMDIGMVILFNAETPLANEVVPRFLDNIIP